MGWGWINKLIKETLSGAGRAGGEGGLDASSLVLRNEWGRGFEEERQGGAGEVEQHHCSQEAGGNLM